MDSHPSILDDAEIDAELAPANHGRCPESRQRGGEDRENTRQPWILDGQMGVRGFGVGS